MLIEEIAAILIQHTTLLGFHPEFYVFADYFIEDTETNGSKRELYEPTMAKFRFQHYNNPISRRFHSRCE